MSSDSAATTDSPGIRTERAGDDRRRGFFIVNGETRTLRGVLGRTIHEFLNGASHHAERTDVGRLLEILTRRTAHVAQELSDPAFRERIQLFFDLLTDLRRRPLRYCDDRLPALESRVDLVVRVVDDASDTIEDA